MVSMFKSVVDFLAENRQLSRAKQFTQSPLRKVAELCLTDILQKYKD